MRDIETEIKERILTEFLPKHPASSLNDTTPLISGGVLDSVKVLQLVTFLEEKYGVQVEAHEVNTDNLDSIADMANFVRAKRGS